MDSELLLELYKSQSSIIYGYLLKQGCKKEEAEDIIHSSFIKAIKYMDGVSQDKLFSWLFKVSINTYKNNLKRKKIINEVSIDSGAFYNKLVGSKDIARNIILQEKGYYVKQCLNSLKESYKSLLIMKYDMELSYKQIGKLLDMKEETVKTYLYRARNKFKKIWRDDYEEKIR